tara:strand:- start:85 stop:759 length:675 start_codon:yes stop_codon:yes gene_type:complete
MKTKSLIDAIDQFRKNIEDNDYVKLGAKGKYLTVPYRLKFVREYFGERIRIITDSFDLDNGSHKFKTEIYLDDKIVATGLSKQMFNKDKEFEKQSTVSCGRALSFLGFFGDELATAEEMEQFLKPPVNVTKVETKSATPTEKPITKNVKQMADDWIKQMTDVAKHSKSQNNFEKNLTPFREDYKSDLIFISGDLIQSERVDNTYNKLKSQIQNNQINRSANNGR